MGSQSLIITSATGGMSGKELDRLLVAYWSYASLMGGSRAEPPAAATQGAAIAAAETQLVPDQLEAQGV